MSTRVQKGGTVFRPVTKARARTADTSSDRQTSLSQDTRLSQATPLPDEAPDSAPPPALSPMPPTVVPVRLSFTPSSDVSNVQTVPSGTPIIVAPSRAPSRVQLTELQPPPVSEGDVVTSSVEDETSSQKTTRRPRSRSGSTTSRKPRKTRRPTTPAFDAEADTGEDLDPTSVTMAALCEDTGQGRVSSKAAQIVQNHQVWKKSNREKRTRMRVIMEAKKYGRGEDAETAQENGAREVRSEEGSTRNTTPGMCTDATSVPTAEDTSGSGFDYSQNVSTSQYNVQVRIGPNGETIVDEESLFVDRNAEEETANYTLVEESDVSKFVNSGTYGKRFRGSRWSAEETELFYDALSQFGENYELISYVLPGRDRKACKNKFKAEDKRNPNRIDFCLKNRRPYDMQTLSRMTGKDFNGPTPEIRAPITLSLADQPKGAEQEDQQGEEDITKTLPAAQGSGEEVLGDVTMFAA
ncbi:hypothetical protein F5J12DRAFT_818397 [Pisolithus orientalis]|uniref:uncharacterized protein n=1 Tax=Pisolithus orientalis TaxID=936130 RepID=UPI00222491F1|nr:uncharacterized protein F5J12DRAFT_818397 [Pisolithus orientalis]KAI6012509.1 hypothetical protein F5J12DRAFT_818397 [Pisolithus orientalis]